MAIIGVGTDIIEIERIKEIVVRQPRFLEKIYSKKEIEICSKKENYYGSLAARFAAKEAIAKAFGTSISWRSVEILSRPNGSPYVKLYGRALGLLERSKIHISISHSKNYATAIIVLEND